MSALPWTSRPVEVPVSSCYGRRALVRQGRGAWETVLWLLHSDFTDASVSARANEAGFSGVTLTMVHLVRQELGIPVGRYRRSLMTAQLCGLTEDKVVAEWLGCPTNVLTSWRRNNGIDEYSWDRIAAQLKSPERINWKTVDLTRPSTELVAELNCSFESVAMARARYGVVVPQKRARTRQIDWDAQPFGVLSDRVIAERLGVDRSTVRTERIARNIAPVQTPGAPVKYHVDWRKVDFARRTDQNVAAEVGCSLQTVRRRRRQLGFSAYRGG